MIRTDTPARRAHGTVTHVEIPATVGTGGAQPPGARPRTAWMAWHRNGDPAGTIYYRHDDDEATRDPYAEALGLIGLRRPHLLNPAIRLAREGWDDGDRWASAILALDAVDDVLAHLSDRGALEALIAEDDGSLTAGLARGVLDCALERRDLALAARALVRYIDATPESGRY